MKNHINLPFHPVACSSIHVGTSLEELALSSAPTINGWESARYCQFPVTLVLQFNTRSELFTLSLQPKPNHIIPSLDVYIGEGITHSYDEANYLLIAYTHQ